MHWYRRLIGQEHILIQDMLGSIFISRLQLSHTGPFRIWIKSMSQAASVACYVRMLSKFITVRPYSNAVFQDASCLLNNPVLGRQSHGGNSAPSPMRPNTSPNRRHVYDAQRSSVSPSSLLASFQQEIFALLVGIHDFLRRWLRSGDGGRDPRSPLHPTLSATRKYDEVEPQSLAS